MGDYTMFGRFENPRGGMQSRNLTTNVPKILDLKSSSEQIFSKNCRWVPLKVNSIKRLLEIDENTARKFTVLHVLENCVNNIK